MKHLNHIIELRFLVNFTLPRRAKETQVRTTTTKCTVALAGQLQIDPFQFQKKIGISSFLTTYYKSSLDQNSYLKNSSNLPLQVPDFLFHSFESAFSKTRN